MDMGLHYWPTSDYEQEYGCTRCQAWHGESDGSIYGEHIMWQSKHGTRRRPAGGWPREGCNDAAGTEVAQVRRPPEG